MTSLIRMSDVDTLLLYTIHANLKRIKFTPSLIAASILLYMLIEIQRP